MGLGLTALWWWIDRWRKSSAFMQMNLEQQGAYRNLLDEACLRGGPLPNNQKMLAKASGDALRWRKIRPVVMRHFELKSDGNWHNNTLDKVLAESIRRAEKQRQYRLRGNGSGNGSSGNARAHPDPYPVLSKKKNSVCPHTPRCVTRHACIALIIEDGRKQRVQS